MRCPEPKPVFIAFMAVACALGMVGGYGLQELLQPGRPDWGTAILSRHLCIGFCLGAAIGMSVALSVRSWIRVVVSFPTGFGAYVAGFMLAQRAWRGATEIEPILLVGALACGTVPVVCLTIVQVMFHHDRARSPSWILAFLVTASLSNLAEPFHWAGGVALGLSWTKSVGGLLLGLLVYLATIGAVGLDRRMLRAAGNHQ